MQLQPLATRLLVVLQFIFCCLGAVGAAQADEALSLDPAQAVIEAWPAARVGFDASRQATLDEMRARVDSLAPPGPGGGNLGLHREVIWIHLPMRAQGPERDWVLALNYPFLPRIRVHLLRDGQLLQTRELGSAVAPAQRPLPSSAHALTLRLAPQALHEIWIRVEAQGIATVPLRFYSPEAFWRQQLGEQRLAALCLGLGLALVGFSLVQWGLRRQPLFGWYGAMALAGLVYFATLRGLLQPYLWPEATGFWLAASTRAALLCLGGLSMFFLHALRLAGRWPANAWALRGCAAVAGGLVLLSGLGVVSDVGLLRGALIFLLLPMAVALWPAWVLAREGDLGARWMLMGWAGSTVCVAVYLAGALGALAEGTVTRYALTAGALFDALAWVAVLSQRAIEASRARQRLEVEKQHLHDQAHTDALTGLPNRRALAALLAQALPPGRRPQPLALFVADLDGFKAVNDSLGHDAGDAVLCQAAARLRAALRAQDVVARLGGDEFVLLARGLATAEEAERLGAKLLAALHATFELPGGAVVQSGLSLGYALAPADGSDADTLLQRADAALIAAKRAGKGRLRRARADAALAPQGVSA
jgi:diguanylate cyclase